MKFLDRYLRDYRINMASKYIKPNTKLLDLGCFDGYLFEKLKYKPIQPSIGIDPLADEQCNSGEHQLIRGLFPESIPKNETFDCIIMLAVLEHIPRETQQLLSKQFYTSLNPKGRVIISVPSKFVDYILLVLSKLRLIDGMSLDEHYGFEVKEVYNLFEQKDFKLITHKRFQLGLNNLFVFEKIS